MSVVDVFKKQFGATPAVHVRAPGRVNLIGEHIDYSGGHVLPVAIDRGIDLVARPRAGDRFRLISLQFHNIQECTLPPEKQSFWTDYVFGVVHEFGKMGFSVPALDIAVDGTIPRGAGLSSSAALEVATAWAIQNLVGSSLSRQEIALLAQRAENRFVGVNCGIMDQTASACAAAGHALLLDCNTLAATHIPLGLGGRAAILVAHSGVHRGLSASAYNERRRQCDAALEVIRSKTGREIAFLCAATPRDLDAAKDDLDDTMFRRARHAISEESRVCRAAGALRAGKLEEVGALFNESHASLRDDYEVSCPELDDLAHAIRAQDGVFGSRLTGAGFGGCTVSLVAAAAAKKIVGDLRKNYYLPRGICPIVFVTKAHDGVALMDV